MIGSFGEVLVLDWGVAKILRQVPGPAVSLEADTLRLSRRARDGSGVDGDPDTAHGTIIGTPGYMSPEQARGEVATLDERADVYSLGAILYYLLTNQRPPATETMPRPRELNRKITKAAQAICLKAMAPAQSARYASATELSAEIAHLLDDEPVSAYQENVFEKVGRWLGKNRFLVFLVLAYLLMRIFFILTARH
jgi:serine/threonine protein kinase